MQQRTKRFRRLVGVVLAFVAVAGLVVACNTHPVELSQAQGAISKVRDFSPGSAAAIDILWVIDNSGSMCEEQKALRTNFREFIRDITARNIDFHIGVTTTQTSTGKASYDTVARPGELQSMPQPVAIFPECHGDPGDPNIDDDGYEPIRTTIELVVDNCTKEPDEWQHLKDVTDDEIYCNINGNCADGSASPHLLYPTTPSGIQPRSDTPSSESPYIELPKVLKAEDYRNEETQRLDEAGKQRLERHFSCMSLVGTSGDGIEKGLASAVETVSLEKTGGPVEAPVDESAPNFGFLRRDSNLALIFVTDENDCSHDGTVDERTTCFGDICAFANNPDLEDTPLLSIESLANDFERNVDESKGRNVDRDSLVVASIHGNWRRYGQDYPDPVEDGEPLTPDWCYQNTDTSPPEGLGESTSCESSFGTARSGDRYDRFLREFNPENIFPEPSSTNPDAALAGLICRPDLIADTLASIGEKVARAGAECIEDIPYECQEDADCFDYMFGEGTPQCVQFGGSDKNYCTSGLQVRMLPTGDNRSFSDLQDHDYCIPESIGSSTTPDGCVVKPEKYNIIECSYKSAAIDLEWEEDLHFEDLEGYTVELIYTLRNQADEEEEGESTNNGQ